MVQARSAKADELPKVFSLLNTVFRFSSRGLSSVEKIFPQVFNERNLENIRIISEDEEPISHLAIWEGEILIYGFRFNIGMFGCVCTHPSYRGRGYATILVEDALDKVRNDGVEILMISGSRGLYRRAGCVDAGMIYPIEIPLDVLGRVNTSRIEVSTYSNKFLDSIVEIYQREPIRYKRSLEEFRTLLERSRESPLEVYVTSRVGKSVAYIATSILPGECPTIWEYAGSREAVLGTILSMVETLNTSKIAIVVPFHDREMLSLLESLGLVLPDPRAPASFSLPNPSRFIEKIKPYFEEKIGEEISSRLSITVNDSNFTLELGVDRIYFKDVAELTSFLLVGPEVSYSLKGDLKKLCKALPLPTPVYGLNYL